MTTDQKQDASREVFSGAEMTVAANMRVAASDLATLRMLGDTGLLWATGGMGGGCEFGRAERLLVNGESTNGPLPFIRKENSCMNAEDFGEANLIVNEHNIDVLSAYRLGLKDALLTTPQAAPAEPRPTVAEMYDFAKVLPAPAQPAPRDETAFQAFMLAVHEHGTSGLGYRKALAAYEAARTKPQPEVYDQSGNGNHLYAAHPDRAEVERVADAVQDATGEFNGGYDQPVIGRPLAVFIAEKMLSAMPTHNDGGLVKEMEGLVSQMDASLTAIERMVGKLESSLARPKAQQAAGAV